MSQPTLFDTSEGEDDFSGPLNELRHLIAKFTAGDDIPTRARKLNAIRTAVADFSPFNTEPVDLVLWVPSPDVQANDYNPNSVAPPEMELLRLSIMADGYTQPIVTNEEDRKRTVVDGFHRNRVGKECPDVNARVHNHLPVVQIRASQTDTTDRMASTIRHNRARGKHRVDGMSDIVVELKRRNWSNDRIARELGMDQDEVLRLCQITGLTELFSDQQFSKSWVVDGDISTDDFTELTDDATAYGEEAAGFRTVNTSDENRIFHTYDKWECHKAGFYSSSCPLTREQALAAYPALMKSARKFSAALERVITEWVHSCEHYLTNTAMNRIAWLGQAAVCIASGVPSEFRGGFSLLTESERAAADKLALKYLNKWLESHSLPPVDMEAACSHGRQSEIY